MKTRISAVVLALLLSALLATAAGAGRTPFLGGWEATDLDGSSMTLRMGGGSTTFRVSLRDDGATICNPDDPFEFGATARGTAFISGPNLAQGFWDVTCQTRPPTLVLERAAFSFTYLPGSDQLWDGSVLWDRR